MSDFTRWYDRYPMTWMGRLRQWHWHRGFCRIPDHQTPMPAPDLLAPLGWIPRGVIGYLLAFTGLAALVALTLGLVKGIL